MPRSSFQWTEMLPYSQVCRLFLAPLAENRFDLSSLNHLLNHFLDFQYMQFALDIETPLAMIGNEY